MQLLNIPVCHDPAHDGRAEAAHYNATLLNCARCGGTYQVQGGTSRSHASAILHSPENIPPCITHNLGLQEGSLEGAEARVERSAATGRPQLRVRAGLLATFCLGYTCGDTWELGYHGCLCRGDTIEEAASGGQEAAEGDQEAAGVQQETAGGDQEAAGGDQEAAGGGQGAVSVGGHGRTSLVMVLLTAWMWGSS